LLPASWSFAAETIPVPGGTVAVARLLGTLDQSPENFVLSLNRVLLRNLYVDEKWESHDDRVRLVGYLRDIEDLQRKLPMPLKIGLEPKPLRKNFQALSDFLGYQAKIKKNRITVLPKDGDQAARRQRLAQALAWDLPRLAEALEESERVSLEIPTDRVEVPFGLARWGKALGHPVSPSEALVELAKNQRLSFLLEGIRRVSGETATTLDRIGWEWLSRQAAAPLYRYSAALRVHDGALLLPGGKEATPIWSHLLGEDPRQTTAFLKELLTRKNGQAAFLWHALTFAPPPVVDFYLGGAATRRPEGKYVKKLFQRLDETTHLDFDHARGGDLGFGTFVRSVPLAEDGESFALEGGPELWFVAIRDEESPTDHDSLARLVRKGQQRDLDEGEFLLKTLNEHVKVLGVKRPVLPRLIRTSHMFGSQKGLLTPGNVILLARASDAYPSVLAVLDDLELSRPETVEQYLLTIAHLDRREMNPDIEVLIQNFEGGVEWLRLLGRAGKMPEEVLEGHLERWSRIHRGQDDPLEAAPQQLEWIVSLLDGLPEAPSDAPGRGRYERNFLHALIGHTDPLRFSWRGLDYTGRRARDLATRMAAHLARQGIPSADEIRSVHLDFQELEQACSEGSLEAAKEAALRLRQVVGGWPGSDLDEHLTDKELRARISPIDRPRFEALLLKIAKQKKGKKLPRQLDDVAEARKLLARELRPFVLSSAYLSAMAEATNVLFDDPNLVRKHLFFLDSPWRRASVETVEGSELGAHISGHLSTLARAIADYSLAGGGGGLYPTRDRVFYKDFLSTRWHELSVDLNRMVATLVATGKETHAKALVEIDSGGPFLDFLGARVPHARVEREVRSRSPVSLLSTSEYLMVGLAAHDGDEYGPRDQLELEPAIRRSFEEARGRLGGEWHERLALAGGVTPSLNGRSQPWVGTWPPYEAVETERQMAALFERQMLDLKLVIIDYLGRNRLPGVVGQDLMAMVLPKATSRPALEGVRDWEGYLRWLNLLDDDYLDDKLRQCMRQGLYTVKDF
jgi:hypothetical protein